MCYLCQNLKGFGENARAGTPAGTTNASSSTATLAALPSFNLDRQAQYLTDGFWQDTGWGRHQFDVKAGGTLSVNLTGLAAFAKQTAVDALSAWTAVSGINFVQTDSWAQINFSENQAGAWANSDTQGSTIISSVVNVASNWTQYGWYYLQSYIHEIGHALGLGHAGNYNGGADFGKDARYQEDSWQYSIMSYFNQDQNPYSSADYSHVVTPMMADIVAIQNLYGVPTNTRTGNDTYGDHRTTTGNGTDIPSFLAQTIFDAGGVDTIDLSLRSANQRLDLRAESFSDIDGHAGNLAIARGTVIENAVLGSGNDTVTGNAAANTISGGGGNDILDGGAGADKLYGGFGDDIFVVDNAGDLVVEYANQGTDLVRSSVSFELGANIEKLELTGSGNINGRGNALANTITGNDGANVLFGGDGNDTLIGGKGDDRLDGGAGFDKMTGGLGNDIYVVDNAYERPIEAANEGIDTVETSLTYRLGANLENLTLTGHDAISGSGNYMNNVIIGNDNNNVLDGLGGNDILTGGAGSDTFVFSRYLNAKTNVGTITDFAAGQDFIQLDDAIFSALLPGKLSAAEFTIGKSAANASQHIVYDNQTGSLFYDADGSGSASQTLFAKLSAGLALGAGDFLVV
ncbi:M10 family metallopeptidase [Aureimonas psammosilenae]|uniref:M10 family metallopeptidase n=1 Tax=Aureimonas psammosilenae TaxID=2495496 RepID=UPI0012604768|nr:M10 family metallopeptidase [Aureimonas psammosilenae]